jgi:uncharacterized hydantoinase/oxoprolinase family protein
VTEGDTAGVAVVVSVSDTAYDIPIVKATREVAVHAGALLADIDRLWDERSVRMGVLRERVAALTVRTGEDAGAARVAAG